MSQPIENPEPTPEQMTEVDRHPWGPTEPDEMAVLGKLYGYDQATGTFTSHVGD